MKNFKNEKPIIPIFFASDDNYVPFLAVSIESIKENCCNDYNYQIAVLCNKDNISNENMEKLYKMNADNFDIEFVDVSTKQSDINHKMYTRDYYSKAIYYRLFIAEMFPEYDKALYLDCDIAVTGDISKLFNIDLGDNYFGAVSDGSIPCIKEFQDYVEVCVGVDKFSDYINSGVLLLNTKKLRELRFEELFIDCLSVVTFDVAPDQDLLNAIFKNKILHIDEKWNKMPIAETIPENEIQLIHYNLNFKPWLIDDVMYESYFWDFAKRTEYYDKICAIKASRTPEMKQKELEVTQNLIANTKKQAEDIEFSKARLKKIRDLVEKYERELKNK